MPNPKGPEPAGKAGPGPPTRKRWIKKTPLDVFLEQEQKLRDEVTELETELKQKRAQLQKFEEARKIVAPP